MLSTLHCREDSMLSCVSGEIKDGSQSRGSRCEVMSLDARINKKGDYELKPSTAPLDVNSIICGEKDQYALTYTRYFDQKGKMVGNALKIKSPHILKALKSLVNFYPGAPVITDMKVTYQSPYELLLHHLEDLKTYRANSEDDVVKIHINLLIRFVEVEMSEELGQLKTLLPAKKITFRLAWAIFRPGNTVLAAPSGSTEKYRIYSTEYLPPSLGGSLRLKGEQIDYDGIDFRVSKRPFTIRAFSGAIDIKSIQVCPVEFHPAAENLKQSFIDRGHRWFNIQRSSPKIMACDGVYIAAGGGQDRLQRFTSFGRIFIDNRMYGMMRGRERATAPWQQSINELTRALGESMDVVEHKTDEGCKSNPIGGELVSIGPNDQLTDEDAALCTPYVRGYSINKRMWAVFDVDTTKEIEWSLDAFDKLILRKESKDAILALVQAHFDTPASDMTHDLVKGKGLGMIFLLHGPPGVGKTLTAETIAEHLQRPLYIISGGELGVTPFQVEINLANTLEVATAWKAIVLIDEADVFLQQRDSHNLERNSLVAIFLRQLEYFEGLMFLTTNRADCIDEAFRSRIDVALFYPELSETLRSKLWESSLKSLDPNTLDMDFGALVPELAKEKMNGREIRKIIKAARLMAAYHKQKLTVDHLRALMGFRMIGSLPEMVEDFDKKPGGAKRQRRGD